MTGKAKCVFVQLAIRIKRERKEEFGVRLGKLHRRKVYRKVLGVRIGIVPIFT